MLAKIFGISESGIMSSYKAERSVSELLEISKNWKSTRIADSFTQNRPYFLMTPRELNGENPSSEMTNSMTDIHGNVILLLAVLAGLSAIANIVTLGILTSVKHSLRTLEECADVQAKALEDQERTINEIVDILDDEGLLDMPAEAAAN